VAVAAVPRFISTLTDHLPLLCGTRLVCGKSQSHDRDVIFLSEALRDFRYMLVLPFKWGLKGGQTVKLSARERAEEDGFERKLTTTLPLIRQLAILSTRCLNPGRGRDRIYDQSIKSRLYRVRFTVESLIVYPSTLRAFTLTVRMSCRRMVCRSWGSVAALHGAVNRENEFVVIVRTPLA
jgi:hypothetical protein